MLFTPTWKKYLFDDRYTDSIPRNGNRCALALTEVEPEIAASQNYMETIFDDHFYIYKKER